MEKKVCPRQHADRPERQSEGERAARVQHVKTSCIYTGANAYPQRHYLPVLGLLFTVFHVIHTRTRDFSLIPLPVHHHHCARLSLPVFSRLLLCSCQARCARKVQVDGIMGDGISGGTKKSDPQPLGTRRGAGVWRIVKLKFPRNLYRCLEHVHARQPPLHAKIFNDNPILHHVTYMRARLDCSAPGPKALYATTAHATPAHYELIRAMILTREISAPRHVGHVKRM